MKVYVLTIGRELYYATKDYEDAKYEKEYTEEENMMGRKLGIKLSELDIDESNPDMEVTLANGIKYTVGDILYLL